MRLWCNKCGGSRIHSLKFTHYASDGDPSEDRYYEAWSDSLWVCCGCESASLLHRWEMVGAEGEPGAPQPEVHVYPSSTAGKSEPKHFIKLPRQLSELYTAIVAAANSGSMVLCTLGLRALIEGVCKDKGLTGDNLEKKIDGLLKFFPNLSLIDSLHGFRFAGNDAAHDLEGMYPSEVSLAIEIMEDLMNFIYELDYKASKLKAAAKMIQIRAQRLDAKAKIQ